MIYVSGQELSIINEILREHSPNGEARAFGSRYRGTNKKYSDLDLAIVKPHKLAFDELAQIREAFEMSELPFRVDVLDYNAVSEQFRSIINEGYEVI